MGKLIDEQIVIDGNKVYSSYYARACKILPNRRMIGVSLGIPDWFNGEVMRCLMPTPKLLKDYKSGSIDEQKYEKIYREEVLSKLNVTEVYALLRGKVIICHCGKGKFCHRHIVLQWIAEELGDTVIGGEI